MFSVLNAVLIVPLPFPEPDRLVQIWGARRDVGWQQASLSHANFWDIADLARDFTEIGGLTFTGLNMTGREAPARLGAAQVSVGFLRALGVTPVAGPAFLDRRGSGGHDNAVVVLSYRFWQSRFGAAPERRSARPMTLDGKPSLIVGVLPDGTPLPRCRRCVHAAGADGQGGSRQHGGRRRGTAAPRRDPAQAQADLSRVARPAPRALSRRQQGLRLVIEPSSEWLASDTTRRALWVLMGAVGACCSSPR